LAGEKALVAVLERVLEIFWSKLFEAGTWFALRMRCHPNQVRMEIRWYRAIASF